MTYVLYGAAGVLAVLLLLVIGAFVGWKLRVAFEKHNRRVVAEELTEEQKRQFRADQEAFDALANYSVEQAYDLRTSVSDLARKE